MRNQLPEGLRDVVLSQDGVVTRRQALAAGLSKDAVRARLESGHWQRVKPGIYAVFTGELPRRAALWAAILQAGPDAMLSHQTAAEIDGLTSRPTSAIHLTIPGQRHTYPSPGLVLHRSRRAAAARHPTRTPPRTRIEETVLDLATSARSFDEAFGWLAQACGGHFTTPARLREAMADRGKMRWRPEIAVALDDVADGAHSGLEFRYLRDVERAHGLPRGSRQARTLRGGRGEYRDILYEQYRVVVETDGRAAHPSAVRWMDAARDNAAAARGLVTLRYSWSDTVSRPCEVAAEVAAVLRQRGWPGIPQRCGPGCPVRHILLAASGGPTAPSAQCVPARQRLCSRPPVRPVPPRASW